MALKIFKIHHSGSHDLFNQMVKIPDLVINFSVTKPSHVFIMGSVGYAHRKIPLDVSTKSKSEIRDLKNRYGQNLTEYAIGIVGRLEHIDENNSRIWIKGSKWGINISSGSDHYGVIPISGYLEVNLAIMKYLIGQKPTPMLQVHIHIQLKFKGQMTPIYRVAPRIHIIN